MTAHVRTDVHGLCGQGVHITHISPLGDVRHVQWPVQHGDTGRPGGGLALEQSERDTGRDVRRARMGPAVPRRDAIRITSLARAPGWAT